MKICLYDTNTNRGEKLASALRVNQTRVVYADKLSDIDYIKNNGFDIFILALNIENYLEFDALHQIKVANPKCFLIAYGNKKINKKALYFGANEVYGYSIIRYLPIIITKYKYDYSPIIKIENFMYDRIQKTLHYNFVHILLGQKQTSLVDYLFHNIGKVLQKRDVVQEIYNTDSITDICIRQLIFNVNKKVGVEFIRSIRNRGIFLNLGINLGVKNEK